MSKNKPSLMKGILTAAALSVAAAGGAPKEAIAKDITQAERAKLEQLINKDMKITSSLQSVLFSKLETRFNQQIKSDNFINNIEDKDFTFDSIKKALEKNPLMTFLLYRMESVGGNPQLYDVTKTHFIFIDFSDRSSEDSNDVGYSQVSKMASEIGVDVTLEKYKVLQDKFHLDVGTWDLLLRDAATRKGNLALSVNDRAMTPGEMETMVMRHRPKLPEHGVLYVPRF